MAANEARQARADARKAREIVNEAPARIHRPGQGQGEPANRPGGAFPVTRPDGGQRKGTPNDHQGAQLPEGKESTGGAQTGIGKGGGDQTDR